MGILSGLSNMERFLKSRSTYAKSAVRRSEGGIWWAPATSSKGHLTLSSESLEDNVGVVAP